MLYYPSSPTDQIKNVSDRELMDDAIAVMQQEKMLSCVGNQVRWLY